ncbi:MAG: hypothetical protein VR64_23870 [Desulfatitalea sp. BRH_c12]|nr:MAG: hypothetical protein VR64_23870 [Desulfatitalea sp. BRH_c12]
MITCAPATTVVIVTYNSRVTIGETLDALYDAFQSGCIACIVVDNASNDGTADFIADRYPWVILIRCSRNLGYGRGCNRSFEHVITRYLLFLNPDARIDLSALTSLTNFMESHPSAGMCGPAVIEASGGLQPSGGIPNPWKIMLKPLLPGWASRGQRHVAPGEPPVETDWICGSIMLLRKRVIDEIGGFDPRFFLYFEDTDLCYRTRQAGWELWTVGESVCTHVNAASAKTTKEHMMWGTISEHYFKSRFYYLTKHFGRPWAIIAEIGELSFMFFRATVDLLRGSNSKNLKPRLRSPILKLPARVNDAEKNIPCIKH